jgi:hypothetical protein
MTGDGQLRSHRNNQKGLPEQERTRGRPRASTTPRPTSLRICTDSFPVVLSFYSLDEVMASSWACVSLLPFAPWQIFTPQRTAGRGGRLQLTPPFPAAPPNVGWELGPVVGRLDSPMPATRFPLGQAQRAVFPKGARAVGPGGRVHHGTRRHPPLTTTTAWRVVPFFLVLSPTLVAALRARHALAS